MTVGIIVQARTHSSRLPFKVLKEIGEKPLIEYLLERLKRVKNADRLIVATTKKDADNPIERICKIKKVDIFRGSNNNVLRRFYKTAVQFNLNIIVRITADCPLSCPDLIDKMIDKFTKSTDLNYLSNTIQPTYPDGLDIEIFTKSSLEEAHQFAKTEFEREHVTPYMKTSNKMTKSNFFMEKDYSHLRLTVDYHEDFTFLQLLSQKYPQIWKADYYSIIKILKKESHLLLNKRTTMRDEGSLMNKNKKLWNKAKDNIVGTTMLFSKNPNLHCPGKWPAYFKKAKGCEITDIDNRKFLDFSYMGVGTNLLGYGNKIVDKAVRQTINQGNMSTLNCPEEVLLSEKLLSLNPWASQVKFCRSGGEANAIALRLSRISSQRNKVAICGYHGWHDWYLSANLNKKSNLNEHLLKGLGVEGIPPSYGELITTFRYGKKEEFDKAITDPACGTVIMEVARNKKIDKGFLSYIRERTRFYGINLVFDECSSGFRKNLGGLYEDLDFAPDAVMYGKALGNGYAINAVLGSNSFMKGSDTTFISSTFWSERIGPTAALATLDVMEEERSYEAVHRMGNEFRNDLTKICSHLGLKVDFLGIPALSTFLINDLDPLEFKTFIAQEMLKEGYLTTNTIYFSIAHTKEKREEWLGKLSEVLSRLSELVHKKKSLKKFIEGDLCITGFGRLN